MKIIGSDKGLRSPQFHMKKEKERKIRLALKLILAVLVVITPLVVLHSERFLIAHVSVVGNTVTKNDDIESIVAKDLSGNYALVVPRASTFFYPKEALEADILQAVPRLGSVDIERNTWRGLDVTVAERTPAALYCTDVTDVNAPSGCYFMDDQGLIFSEAPAFSGGVYVAYTTEEPMSDPVGKQFLDPDSFVRLGAMLSDIELLHLTPKVLVVKDDSYYLSLPTGTAIIWKAKDDPKAIESNLVSFINDTSIFGDARNVSDLAYIDLRFGNKVFYKFRNE